MITVEWKCPKCKWTGTQTTSWDPLLLGPAGQPVRSFYCPSKKCDGKQRKLIGTKPPETDPAPTFEDDHESLSGLDGSDTAGDT